LAALAPREAPATRHTTQARPGIYTSPRPRPAGRGYPPRGRDYRWVAAWTGRRIIWEVFYLPPSVFFRCSSTFDARHSLNRFPFAGSVTQLNKKMKSSAVIGWIVKQQLFAFPKSRDVGSTFDGRHSLNRFPFAGSVTQQENEIERCDWLDRKATTFCVP